MTNLHRFVIYAIGMNDQQNSSAQDILDSITCGSVEDIMLRCWQMESGDIGEWIDEHELNYKDCPKESFDKYLDPKLNELISKRNQAERELENYKKTHFKKNKIMEN